VSAGIAAALLAPSFVSAETIQSKICTPFSGPTITAPADNTTTNDSAISVAGSGEAGLVVSVYDNGSGVGATTVASDGSYAIQVPLSVGGNQLTARITNDCNTIKESQDINVVRTVVGGGTNAPDTGAGGQGDTPSDTGSTSSTPKTPVITDLNTTVPSTSQAMSPQVNVPLTTEQIKAQQQIITQPKANETVSSDRLLVAGTATPFSVVDIYINEHIVARVIAAANGSYRAIVDLQSGSNSIHVQATDSDGAVTTRTISIKLDKSVAPGTSVAKPSSTGQTVLVIVVGAVAAGGITLAGILSWHTHTLHMRMRKINHV